MSEKTDAEQQPTFSELVNASDAFIAKNRVCLAADALDELHFVLKAGEDYRIVMDKGPDVISTMIREETMKVFKGFKIPDHLLSSGSVIANFPITIFPSRAFSEIENRIYTPRFVINKRRPKKRYLKSRKISMKFTPGQLKFAAEDFPESRFSNYLTPVWSITGTNTPMCSMYQLEALGKRFTEAMEKYDHKHLFVLGVDVVQAGINAFNVSNKPAPPAGGCLLNISGYKERNFLKAYGKIAEEILAIRF